MEFSLFNIVIVYLLIINVIAFIFFGFDKMKSLKKGRRVSEKRLWFLALIGGSVGSLLAMNLFRHKTKKISFQAVLAIIIAFQVFLVYYLFLRK